MTFSLLPLILLTITLISLLISQSTNQELLKLLTVILTIIALIWGLTVSHWSITLFVLLLISKIPNLLGLFQLEGIKINK